MELISLSELMDILDIGKNTAYKLLISGEIDAFKIGSKWKIPRTSVENYIQSRTNRVK